MTADPLDDLLATIDQLEDDTDDTYPWTDAARWTPGASTAALAGDPYDVLPAPADGCVVVCDPARPWVVVEYVPPWWAQ